MLDYRLAGWIMVICNPASGSGAGRAVLERLRHTLDREKLPYTSEITARRGDAARLARAAVLSGCGAVFVIGGDGTLFEVVNGLMDPASEGTLLRPEVAVGLVQTGRGSDFGRSVGIPSDIDAAFARLLAGRTQRIDLGHVHYRSFRGEVRSRYFANAAGLGFDAEVTLRANSASHALGSTIPYLSSLFATLGTYRNKRMRIETDALPEWQGRVNSIVVANGQYFGGGMRIAPNAEVADGSLDVVVLGDLGKLDLVRNVPRVYDGSHLTHPKVRSFSAMRVQASSPDRVLLQADGEVLGTAPASFHIVPSVLTLIV